MIDLNQYVNTIENFPMEWISFKDISPILYNPIAFQYTIDELSKKSFEADVIVWLDARWFIFWSALAYKLSKPFVMIRKKWKLPWKIIEESYELEYWNNIQTIQIDTIKKWQKVAIIDDLLATGWTAACACNLIERVWWIVQWCHFVLTLNSLNWYKKLSNYHTTTILSY